MIDQCSKIRYGDKLGSGHPGRRIISSPIVRQADSLLLSGRHWPTVAPKRSIPEVPTLSRKISPWRGRISLSTLFTSTVWVLALARLDHNPALAILIVALCFPATHRPLWVVGIWQIQKALGPFCEGPLPVRVL